jgi:Uma2 family endonuclease
MTFDPGIKSGARSVWVVDPKKRTATIWRANGSGESVAENEVLRDESVLPGFSLELQRIL